MSKKELRKELELSLLKALEDILNKKNTEITKKIRKTSQEASKIVAKKFFKNLNTVTQNKTVITKKIFKKVIPVKKITAVKSSSPRPKAVKTN